MEDVEKYRQDKIIISETAQQLIKDFSSAGIQLNFSGDVFKAYDELLHQLIPLMADLYKNDQHVFKQLLYRIDIPEKKYRSLRELSQNEFIPALADVILKREFEKVLTRYFFKKES